MSETITMTDEKRIALQRACIIEHMRGENTHDWPAVYDTFVRDERAWYDVVPLSKRFDGFSGVQDFYETLETAIPDFQLSVSGEYDTPGCSIREVTLTGTHQGEFLGIPASGNPILFELCALYIFGVGDEAGKLLAERVYFDTGTVLSQMRGEAEAPRGIGLSKGG